MRDVTVPAARARVLLTPVAARARAALPLAVLAAIALVEVAGRRWA